MEMHFSPYYWVMEFEVESGYFFIRFTLMWFIVAQIFFFSASNNCYLSKKGFLR
jgi:hypothetical protein